MGSNLLYVRDDSVRLLILKLLAEAKDKIQQEQELNKQPNTNNIWVSWISKRCIKGLCKRIITTSHKHQVIKHCLAVAVLLDHQVVQYITTLSHVAVLSVFTDHDFFITFGKQFVDVAFMFNQNVLSDFALESDVVDGSLVETFSFVLELWVLCIFFGLRCFDNVDAVENGLLLEDLLFTAMELPEVLENRFVNWLFLWFTFCSDLVSFLLMLDSSFSDAVFFLLGLVLTDPGILVIKAQTSSPLYHSLAHLTLNIQLILALFAAFP